MSNDNAALLSRLAALEAEVSGYRNAKQARPEKQFDPDAFRAALIADPDGVMTRMGVPVDHITKVLVAKAMGDQAPPELKVLAAMGPQVNATHALDAKLESLSRQFSDLTASQRSQATRESFKAITKDKSKYPHLARALADDPSLFDDEIAQHGGSAEEFAAAAEARHARVAKAYGYTPPASTENAEANSEVQSTQDKPAALEGTPQGSPPPIPSGSKPGVFTQEEHTKLRDEIVRKYSSPPR